MELDCRERESTNKLLPQDEMMQGSYGPKETKEGGEGRMKR